MSCLCIWLRVRLVHLSQEVVAGSQGGVYLAVVLHILFVIICSDVEFSLLLFHLAICPRDRSRRHCSPLLLFFLAACFLFFQLRLQGVQLCFAHSFFHQVHGHEFSNLRVLAGILGMRMSWLPMISLSTLDVNLMISPLRSNQIRTLWPEQPGRTITFPVLEAIVSFGMWRL